MAVALAVVVAQHALGLLGRGHFASATEHAQGVALDLMLAVPAAVVAVWLADLAVGRTTGRAPDRAGVSGVDQSRLLHAAAVSLISVPFLAALSQVQLAIHRMFSDGAAAAATHGHGAAAADDALAAGFTAMAVQGLGIAVKLQPVVFAVALLAPALFALRVTGRSLIRDASRALGRRAGGAVAYGSALVVVAAMAPLNSTPAQAAGALDRALPAEVSAQQAGSCATAAQRVFDVVAINVDITVNRFGDHDPFGFMYALRAREADVRAQEAALKAAATDPNGANGAKVSQGLGTDAIQPLSLRARLGECVVINLQNKLTAPPKGGPGFAGTPVITQPGGVPSVSVDMTGVTYAANDGGQLVGNNPANIMVPPGGSRTYRFFLDPLLGEGARVFRSGGNSVQLTAHGLFGTLIAEPAGSRWLDPRTGADRTNDNTWNSWEAIVAAPNEPAFREFLIAYHEIGDENFNLRRPQREGDPSRLTPDPDGNGAPLPMLDEQGLANAGGLTDSYRPGSRAINYRSESFYRRTQSLTRLGFNEAQILAGESLAYGSYMYGDPATPIPRSYLGEPTKTRLVHAGGEQLHVHHLHGGGDRWRQNEDADDTDIASGLRKVPIQNARSIRLDSQTVGPQESYNLEHECGAGGCQQSAGDFLFHCHIAHHYIAGMWSFWRVFDTRQADLATIPGRTAAPAAIDSAGLIGRTIEGKTVVAGTPTSPSTQISLASLVEPQLPPPGVRLNHEDATTWDWTREGTATAPVYKGEPEDTRVWENYQSPTPGVRPSILFNPNNGRPTWPMLKPHFGERPPFSPNGHSGAPWLGETGSSTRPDGLCPASAPLRTYNVTAINVPLQSTARERDNDGQIFVLTEDKDRVKAAANAGTVPDPLAIRSNVGDCVALTLSSELATGENGQEKVNMHTHFVQFDPQASDGVITGFSFEQSVYNDTHEGRTMASASAAGATTINVSNTTNIKDGVFIGIGVGRTSIEIRKIVSHTATTLTFDRALSNAHSVGEPVTVEFVQYRWFSDVDSGTVFWHDHVNGIKSWAHGLFGAHIIEPRGSTYHDPVTGAQVRSGAIVDIHTTNSAGIGTGGSFREYMIWLHNGRRGRPELTNPAFGGILGMNRNLGQECEEGSINLRAAPIGERVPPGTTPDDPATTDQRREFSGLVCRSAFSNDVTTDGSNTVNATVAAVDPHVFSSVKYGDPRTPLLRAYAGDPVMIRTIGLNERAEALRFQGHRFRVERFNADGEFSDTATTGISERYDYILDGGAGGPRQIAGDYMYYSTRNFAFETGAWGIFRVHDKRQSSLQPLPGRTAPPTGTGFPLLTPNTNADPQQNPGPNPPAPSSSNVSNVTDPCPSTAPRRSYDVSIFDQALPTHTVADNNGVIYSLTSDMAGIKGGTKRVEPLVLRANVGDCVQITLRNRLNATSLFGGTRAGFEVGKLLANPQTMGGGAIGLNPDTTVARGGTFTYRVFADKATGTSVFRNWGSEDSQRHGAYGLLIAEPAGSSWFRSSNGSPLGATATDSQAIIRAPSGDFREFALTMQSTDQHFSRSVVPYQDVVAGAGVNSTFAGNPAVGNAQAFSHISYQSEPITERLGLTTSPPNPSPNYGTAFSSAVHGDPSTPIFRAFAGDPIIFRLGIGASDETHAFTVGGHMFAKEPNMWNGGTDRRSHLLSSRSMLAAETLDAEIVAGAGGSRSNTGDYLYGDARQAFAEAGMWGIFRVFGFGLAANGIASL